MSKRASWMLGLSLWMGMTIAQAAPIVTDDFSYVGALTNNGWVAYSGADGSITSDGSVASIGSGAEDIRLAFADQGTGPTYASFTINVATLPTSGSEYSFGFSDSTSMESRFGIISETSGSAYGVTIWAGGGSVLGTFSGLALNTDYQIALYFDGVDDHRLWVDPGSGDFATPDLQATGANAGIDGFFIRQAGALDNGASAWTMGALEVATTFEEVIGGGSSPVTNVRFSASAAAVGEDVGTYEITVIKTLPEGNFSGEIALGGTATLGDDYSIDTTNFTLNGTTTSATFTVTVVDDATEESDETVTLTLANVVGGDVGTPSLFTLTIEDDDAVGPPPGTVTIDFEGVGETKGAYASGTVTLSGLDWDMTDALIGIDASDFKNGVRSARMRGYGTSSMTLLDDLTSGLGSISFQYRRYGTDAQVDWVVEYTTDGSTWNQVGTEFTAPASDDVQTFDEDVNVAGNVRVRIKRFTETGTSNSRFNIDDISLTPFGTAEPTTNVSFSVASASVGEASGTYDVVIVKSLAEGDVSGEIQLGGTAFEGDDYFVSGTNFTMNGAVTSATITITIVDDGDEEVDPTVVLTLANITGGDVGSPSVFTLTIQDNDAPPEPTEGILAYRFTATPFLAVSTMEAGIAVSDMALSAGTIETDINTGTYFPNMPYVEETAGWTATDQATAKSFEFTITPDVDQSVTITGISFRAYATAAGPSAIGYDIGGLASAEFNITNAVLLEVNEPVSGVVGQTAPILVKIQGWLNGTRDSSGGGVLRLDDVVLYGTIAGGGGPVPPPVPDAPVVGTAAVAGGNVSIVIGASDTNFLYAFQYRTNLVVGNWTVLTTSNGTGAAINFIDAAPADAFRAYSVEAYFDDTP